MMDANLVRHILTARTFLSSMRQDVFDIYSTMQESNFHKGIANVADSRTQFFRARAYHCTYGTNACLRDSPHDMFGLRVLDGNHRLAAMASFPNANQCTVDCWIGYSKKDLGVGGF